MVQKYIRFELRLEDQKDLHLYSPMLVPSDKCLHL